MKWVVFGSGGMAKEVIGYLESDGHEVAYVVSPEPFNSAVFARYEVVASPKRDDLPWLLAVAEPAVKRAIVQGREKERWGSYFHSSTFVSPHAIVGRGCIMAPQVIISGDPVIEEFCFFNTNATIGHDSRLGAYSTLFPNAEVCGSCDIGEDCMFGIGAYVIPGITLPAGTKVSAGAVVRESVESAANIYGDPRGQYRVRTH